MAQTANLLARLPKDMFVLPQLSNRFGPNLERYYSSSFNLISKYPLALAFLFQY